MLLPDQISLTVQMLSTSPYHSLCDEVCAEKLLLYSRGLLWPSLGLVSLSFTLSIKRYRISLWPGTSKGVVWARSRLVYRNTPWVSVLAAGFLLEGTHHHGIDWSFHLHWLLRAIRTWPALLSGEAVFQDGTQLFKQMHLQLFLTGIPLTFQRPRVLLSFPIISSSSICV